MDKLKDTYKTLDQPSKEILLKEKKSKFFGYAFPFQSEDEVKPILESIKKQHHTAGHVCYAWQLGTEEFRYRANDDGEPNNSAGPPIYGQIKAFDLTNVLVAVARIYGGTKLGVGGLISAYRTAAQMALEASQIKEKLIEDTFHLSFDYPEMDKVMRVIKQKNYQIRSQKLELTCQLLISARKSESKQLKDNFEAIHKVAIRLAN